MEMAIGAVHISASSQPQAKASESGFSEVLSEVRSSSAEPKLQENTQGYEYESPEAEYSDEITLKAEFSQETAEYTIESFSVEFVHNLKEHLSCGFLPINCENCKDTEETDKIIDALLKILKKMQDESEDDTASNLLMELLASMSSSTGANTDGQSRLFRLSMTKTEISVTSVSSEMTAILSAETEQVQPQVTAELPVQNVNAQSEGQFFVQPEQVNASAEAVTTEATAVPRQSSTTADVQPQTAPQTEADYESLLNDLLNEARKDLGLTKAELKTVPKQTAEAIPEAEIPAEPKADVQSAILPMKHKDGTNELNSILGTAEETADVPEAKQEFKPATAVNGAEINLAGNPTQHTEAITTEAEITVEAPLPEQQLTDEILSKPETLNGGRTEFTMELNPENLGKITVRLISEEGRIDVSVTADKESTRQLLEARAENIGTALKNSGVELERYQVVTNREDAQLSQETYDGSSKNPYGRDDENRNEEEHGDEFLEILQQI